MIDGKILFQEKQRMNQFWPWVIVILSMLLGTIPLVYAIYRSGSGSEESVSVHVILIFIITVLPALLMLVLKQETVITPGQIHFRLYPLHIQYRTISFSETEACFVRSYDPLREYGGWGLKGTRKNRAYNISGNNGLQIVLKDGKRVLLGTQKPEELKSIIQSYFNN